MMTNILQGTTPTLIIRVKKEDILLENVEKIELTFQQWSRNAIIKTGEDLMVDYEENLIAYHFTEQETLDLLPRNDIQWQLRIKTIGGELFGTRISRFDVADLISMEGI